MTQPEKRSIDEARTFVALAELPKRESLNTQHLRRLVDDTGIVQHATGSVPLLASGYCVDDVARLMTVVVGLGRTEPEWNAVVARSVAYVEHAATSRGPTGAPALHNFMAWHRTWLDDPYFGDHVGRALLGLASVASDDRFRLVAAAITNDTVSRWPSNAPLHTTCYALLAQAHAPTLLRPSIAAAMRLELKSAFAEHHQRNWKWFEPALRYDNARYCQALIASGAQSNDQESVEIGLRSLRWYDRLCEQDGFVRFPGHLGLRAGEGLDESGDEQPLEALALVDAHIEALAVTGDAWHRDRACQVEAWFRGRNRLGLMLIDRDGGCCDGLERDGVNCNQGAESTLAYLASHQAVSALIGANSDS